MMVNIPDHTKMYRLPHTKNDNPNGWIEITTHCNMQCPGCYKGVDRVDCKPVHMPLEQVKADIRELKRLRNCDLITITGGEALMHPDIDEIVRYVKSLGLNSFIHTNGLLVSEDSVRRMKKAGLTGFIIRVDTLNRPEARTEAELHHIRQGYAELIHRVGGMQLGFTLVVDKRNLNQVHEVINWFSANHRKADYLVVILKREFTFDPKQKPDTSSEVKVEELARQMKEKIPKLEFSSYLGSELQNIGYKWLQANWISHGGKILAYTDAKIVELATISTHFTKGRYSYVAGKQRNKMTLVQMLFGPLMLSRVRLALRNYLWNVLQRPWRIFSRPNYQVINIVNPPGLEDGYRDYCDGCPDAVLHEGKLVPSCTLESFIQNPGQIEKNGHPH